MKAMLAVKADNALHVSATTTGTSSADTSAAPKKETKWAVVKGSQTVRIYYTPDHTDKGEIPFFTISYWTNGKRSRHVFPTLKAAKKAAKKKAEELDRGDHGAAKLTNADSAAYFRALDLLKPSGASLEFAASEFASAVKRLGGVSLSTVVDYYLRRNAVKIEPKLVQEVVTEMIQLKEADQLSERYINQLTYDMKRFTGRFCNRIGDVRGTDVDAWLRELKVGPRTRNNLRASIQVLFNYAIARKYLEKDHDEMEAIPLAKDKGGEIEIFTPKEMAELLAVASDEQLPFMAISGFAGVRHAEVQRLDWKHVNQSAGIIEIRAGTAKTASRRVIPILPNLAAWLKSHWKEAGPVCSFTNMVDQFRDMTRKVNLARRAAWATAKGVRDEDLKAADARAAKRRKEENKNQKGRRARGTVLPPGSDNRAAPGGHAARGGDHLPEINGDVEFTGRQRVSVGRRQRRLERPLRVSHRWHLRAMNARHEERIPAEQG